MELVAWRSGAVGNVDCLDRKVVDGRGNAEALKSAPGSGCSQLTGLNSTLGNVKIRAFSVLVRV